MASKAKSLIARVVALLQTATPGGGYTHDLSASGVVVRGVPTIMAIPSSAAVFVQAVREDSSVSDAPLTRFRRRLAIRIFGVSSASFAESYSLAEDGVLDLGDDILRALETDRALTGVSGVTVLDTLGPSLELVEGDVLAERYALGVREAMPLPSMPVAVVELVVDYYMTTGV